MKIRIEDSKGSRGFMIMGAKEKDPQVLSYIFNSDLFFNFRPVEKDIILNKTGVIQLQKGELLFSPGKKADHLYFLLRGFIRIFKSQTSGADDEIACFAPGDIIGDFDFARGADYDAYAEAVEDSSLVMFPGSDLSMEKLALEEPQLNSRLLFNSVAMVTDRIKSTRRLIIESAYWVKELHRKVHEDPTTGLWKQTLLNEEINQLLENPMTLVMLKPDRFKVLVDALGHDAGDEAMIKIAAILKGFTHKLGRGWALRFKSNETGILVNKCDAAEAETLAVSLSDAIAALPVVPLDDENFHFSASIAWGIWPKDDRSWDSLFDGIYKLLLDTWRAGGNRIARYDRNRSV